MKPSSDDAPGVIINRTGVTRWKPNSLSSFSVYPNPSFNQFTISPGQPTGNAEIKITDMFG